MVILSEERLTVHGVYMEVLGLGVLLTGESGIGKSELALDLINRGHTLIADDAPAFHKSTNDAIIGTCPDVLQDFLEVRGIGILNIRAMFGDTAIRDSKRLRLIVRLIAYKDEELLKMDRLHGIHKLHNILGVDIPEVTVPVAPGRNLDILVEAAVRNEILKRNGYNASEEFLKHQATLMEKMAS
jgi:HPr kinase/phosphorylase